MIKEPVDLNTDHKKRDTKELVWEIHVKRYVWRVEAQEKNYQSIFSIIWGQYSTSIQNKLLLLGQFEEKQEKYDCLCILKEIRTITLHFKGARYIFLSLDDARTVYYGYTQPKVMSLVDYMRHF